MTESNPIDPLVDGVRQAVVHFGKATYEVAAGVGALFVAITKTVRRDADDAGGSGPQKVEIE